MHEIFDENKSTTLQAAIIWTPMLVADSLDAANECELRFSDPRMTHHWDPDRILGRLLSRTLRLKESVAWDVYLLYPPNRIWDEKFPPVPEFWMHQLGEDPIWFLDPTTFKQKVWAMSGIVFG